MTLPVRFALLIPVLSMSFFVAASATATASAADDDIFGTWKRGDGNAQVKVGPCGNDICAINTWIRDPAKQNEKVGDRLVFRITKKGEGWAGTAYDPQRKLNLNASLIASGASMTTRGCVLGGVLCRSTQWTRN